MTKLELPQTRRFFIAGSSMSAFFALSGCKTELALEPIEPGYSVDVTQSALPAVNALRNAKFTVHEGPVILARVPDMPGGLARALVGFAQRNLNVEYAYAIVQSIIAFGVEDVIAAEAVLTEEGIPLVTPNELEGI